MKNYQSYAQNVKAHTGTHQRKKMTQIKTVDLFAGVGGIRLGFEKAGFKTVFANDIDKSCKHTYDLNFSEPKLSNEDIWKIKTEELPEFDVLLGGFPCQAFSIAGYRKGFKDEKGRGNLFFRIAEILEERKPKAFLLENVKNLKGHDNGRTFKIILETLKKLGYYVKYDVLNSMTHSNIPQNRERVFMVGFLDEAKANNFMFPNVTMLTNKFKNFLVSNPDAKYYYNGKPLFEKIKANINSEETVYQWRRKYVRANKKGVVPTLTANMGTGGHNVPIIKDKNGIRKLTPKECFLLQGFPKSFKLPDIADTSLYHQAGNSVTVPVIERIAVKIRDVLLNKTPPRKDILTAYIK